MNNLVKWQCDFAATVISNREIIPNFFELEIYFSSMTDDVIIQNIGFERLKYFMYELAQTSVITSRHNKLLKNLIKNIDSNIITLPTDPDDQVLLWCIFKKLRKILGANFILQEMRLQSAVGEQVQYHYNGDTHGIEGLDDQWTDGKGTYDFWYNRGDLSTYDDLISDKTGIKLYTGKQTWSDLNLDWQTEDEFVQKMKKDKKNKAKIIKPKKFQIRVLDGKNGNR
jgi:hypothetical protein